MTGSIAGLQGQARQTLDTLNTAGRNIDKLANRVDRLLERNEQQITETIGEAHETLKLLQQTLNASNDILGDAKLRDDMKQTIRKLPEVLEEMRIAVKGVNGTFASMQRNMQNIEGLTEPLGKHGADIVDELDTSMRNLHQLSGNMLRFSEQLTDPQGSLGALLHDKELYPRINHIVKNVDELTRELKPLLGDVAGLHRQDRAAPGVAGRPRGNQEGRRAEG